MTFKLRVAKSLLAKILFWFFLNIALITGLMAVFFMFQARVDLHAVFGRQAIDRMRVAAVLISRELYRADREQWPDVLAKHAELQRVDFVLVLDDGTSISSSELTPPERVLVEIQNKLQRQHQFRPDQQPPDQPAGDPPGRDVPPPDNTSVDKPEDHPEPGPSRELLGPPPISPPDKFPHLFLETDNPTLHWHGIRIPEPGAGHTRQAAYLFAVSKSVSGNGFFFDPTPWVLVALAVVFISVLFWIPMVKHITRPLSRMTRAAETIARGNLEATLSEPRADEIGRLAASFNHMTGRLSDYVKGQKRFLGDVAHELGSPIARIQFGLGSLEQRVDQGNRERVNDVLEDVDHLSKLVNELLAFSRADLKADTVKLENVALLPVVQDAVKRETRPPSEIDIQVAPELCVKASTELLTRALANLLRNAVKYGGQAGPITVRAEKTRDGVEVTVLDQGPGVPPEDLGRLFEPFFRPELSRDRESGGVGLGLAIVKTCVATCQGQVSAANLEPRGFAVTIRLDGC